MKKITLVLLISFYGFSQFSIKKLNGVDFVNEEVVEFTSHSSAESEIFFTVHNTSSQDLNFFLRSESINNATGANFQLCWAYECLPSISSGVIYPQDFNYPVTAGANTVGFGDSFKNFYGGDGTNYPINYRFRFYALSVNDGSLAGDPLFITYRYMGPLGVNSRELLNNMGVKVLNTQVDNYVGLEINQTVHVELFNLQGQKVFSKSLDNNYDLIMTNFNSGVYLLKFSNDAGLNHTVKILKK